MFDSILVIDKNAIIRNLNTKTLKLLGYQANELLGKNINLLK